MDDTAIDLDTHLEPLMVLDRVARRVGPRGETWALKDASSTIYGGEFVAIAGPSGSGKTTLLSILGLLDRPTSGDYWLNGVAVAEMSETTLNLTRGGLLGFVFQNSFLVSQESVSRNVELGLRVRGVGAAERRHRARDALASVGLDDRADKEAGSLSGGEKQRVAVARAMVTNPRIILADEPTGSLDGEATVKLIDILRSVTRTGTTVVVVTHDPLVADAADRVLRLADGVLSENRSVVALSDADA